MIWTIARALVDLAGAVVETWELRRRERNQARITAQTAREQADRVIAEIKEDAKIADAAYERTMQVHKETHRDKDTHR